MIQSAAESRYATPEAVVFRRPRYFASPKRSISFGFMLLVYAGAAMIGPTGWIVWRAYQAEDWLHSHQPIMECSNVERVYSCVYWLFKEQLVS